MPKGKLVLSFQDVLRECDGTRGLDSSIFQTPSLLHLTVCTLSLMGSNSSDIFVSLVCLVYI